MKIFVAIPVYDGKLQVQTVKCLLEENTVANGIGDELRVNFLTSCSVPAQGRNQLVQDFLNSDCDRLFFLDSDISFEPGSIVKLCHMPYDFVGGVYRYKHREEKYPIWWKKDQKQLISNEHGLLEVSMLPTGFLALSRDVFSKFREGYPDRQYKNWNSGDAFAYFQMVFKEGVLYSDDTYFCKEWTEIGGKIYLDPEIKLVHWSQDPTPFVGHIGNFLRRVNNIEGGQK